MAARKPRAQMFTVVPSKRWVVVVVVAAVVVSVVAQPGVVPQPQGGDHHLGEDRAAAVRGEEVRPLPLTDEEDREKVTSTQCSVAIHLSPQVPVSPHQEEVCEQPGEQAEEVHRYSNCYYYHYHYHCHHHYHEQAS